MSRTCRSLLLASVVSLAGASLFGASPAAAAPGWLDPYGKIEAGVAFPLRSPQSDYFGPGFAGRLNLGLGLGEWISVQLTGQVVALPARSTAPTSDSAIPIGLGGGLRLKLPYRYAVYPWIDADLLYVRTGPLDRFGYTVGIGVHVPIGQSRVVRLGPFVRFFQIVDPPAPNVNSTDAMMLIAGASLEIGAAHRKKPLDSDHDGVADLEDRCPDDPGPVSTHGCPDGDGDGIADRDDKCPDQPGPAATHGCPDRDGDGIFDSEDKCPDQAGPSSTGGCPDKDGDGVPDLTDKCPDQPGPAPSGCPDRDKDGVADIDDKCPDQPGPAAAGGCPDKDGDGVPDSTDKCPDQPGPAPTGCPNGPTVQVTEKKILLSEKIFFETDKKRIQERSFPILDEVVKVLKEKPELRIRIEGHTDNRKGEHTDNQRLSQRRANEVRDYLVDHDVDIKRLEAKGYGDSKPLAPNDTDEGREKNRRVEFVIIQ